MYKTSSSTLNSLTQPGLHEYTFLLTRVALEYNDVATCGGKEFATLLQGQLHVYPAFLKNYTLEQKAFGGVIRNEAFHAYALKMREKKSSQLGQFFHDFLHHVPYAGAPYPENPSVYHTTRRIFEMIANFSAPEDAILYEHAAAGAFDLYASQGTITAYHQQHIEQLYNRYSFD